MFPLGRLGRETRGSESGWFTVATMSKGSNNGRNGKQTGDSSQLCGLAWVKRKTWPPLPANTRRKLSIVDLFCGCGGLTLGAWEAARANRRRLDVRLAVDMSEDAIAVYRKNFGLCDSIARQENVSALLPGALGQPPRPAEKRLAAAVGKLDLLVAGPPCQGHSDLNNHTRRSDPRNALYLRVIRAAELFKPKIVLIENVGAIVHDRSKVIARSVTHLEKLGFGVVTSFVRAEELGLPQRRRRHILLAIHGAQSDLENLLPRNDKRFVPISAYLDDLQDEPDHRSGPFYSPSRMTPTNVVRMEYLFKHDEYDLPNRLRPPCHQNGHSYKSMYGRLKWDQPAQTLTTGFGSMGQGRFLHPTRRRMLTPHEAARIQGFPDFFNFSVICRRTSIQQLIGNAVPPRIAAAVLGALLLA